MGWPARKAARLARRVQGLALILAALTAASPASAGEIWLYDQPNFAGAYRVMVQGEPDLDRIDFDNRTGSVRVISGIWRLHRDDNFANNNGPYLEMGPGDYPSLPALGYPDDRMSSLWLTPGNGAVPDALTVLYDEPGFSGSYRVLVESEGDLRRMEFDNETESLRVLAGSWSFHRDFGFGDGNGPPIRLGPGNYPDINQLGFPDDRLSAVRLGAVDAPPPPTVACDPPYRQFSNGACTWTCGPGTVPDQASNSCVCASGLVETGTDPQGRRICGPAQTEQPALACPPNTVAANGACVCAPGTVQTATGAGGFPVCVVQRGQAPEPIQPGIIVEGEVTTAPPAGTAEQTADGVLALNVARLGGWATTVDNVGPPFGDCLIAGAVVTARYGLGSSGASAGTPAGCIVRFFQGGELAPGWSLTGYTVEAAGVGDDQVLTVNGQQAPGTLQNGINSFALPPQPGPTIGITFAAPAPLRDATIRLVSITLAGPAGTDWRAAFQR